MLSFFRKPLWTHHHSLHNHPIHPLLPLPLKHQRHRQLLIPATNFLVLQSHCHLLLDFYHLYFALDCLEQSAAGGSFHRSGHLWRRFRAHLLLSHGLWLERVDSGSSKKSHRKLGLEERANDLTSCQYWRDGDFSRNGNQYLLFD